ncbi:BZ3500_MvSof-1268-A1-R1_Chr1-3g02085 [Microbotryum saponariae]|uniref:BZ3500_MvSof-1268-A1-R1_Chr1-3g02085 protein n=1 Tax=Microbotryum saponariae TaxID=289078 RepID=A0A2X0KW92_9BASI|nr:BZ3500_MvSof-1268-A1-R1_Chr1-3g02085 [Microbotryum saponariae]SCZ95377.1 BZ3501_MvSof-1269-A2-R1_Chr1-3g01687 [Microbotryum saponariae]
MSSSSLPPSILNVPTLAIPVDDVDEEIFLLYTRKLGLVETNSRTSSSEGAAKTLPPGLGFLDTTKEVIVVPLLIEPSENTSSPTKSKNGKISKKKTGRGGGPLLPKELEVMVCQDLQALRHRKGDTGESRTWRFTGHNEDDCVTHHHFYPSLRRIGPLAHLVSPQSTQTRSMLENPTHPPTYPPNSIHLAHHFLKDHYFPSPLHPPLFPSLSHLRVLELGSGTGFLGCALAPFFGHWTFTDQFESLALIQRTLNKNQANDLALMDPRRVEVQELDWVEEAKDSSSNSNSTNYPNESQKNREDLEPHLIIASDCIYNPSLAKPLARTIAKRAIKGKTVVLVASELRDQDALEIFLAEWIELNFEVRRLVFDQNSKGPGLGGNEFVVWIGWKV